MGAIPIGRVSIAIEDIGHILCPMLAPSALLDGETLSPIVSVGLDLVRDARCIDTLRIVQGLCLISRSTCIDSPFMDCSLLQLR